jgi:hypothetical protein
MPSYQIPMGQTDDSQGVLRLDDRAHIPSDPQNVDWQGYEDWKDAGNQPAPPDPVPLRFTGILSVDAQTRTTDDVAHEIYRVTLESARLYQGNLVVFGVDAGNFMSKSMEGRFVFKRAAGGAVVVGIAVVSDIHDSVAASWAPNCLAAGNDVVFTVKGAAGRTIDWLLVGSVGVYAPGGLSAP